MKGTCDSHLRIPTGVESASAYGGGEVVTRFTVRDGAVSADALDAAQLSSWVDGCDPLTGDRRGRDLRSPDTDLILDGTINAPKTFSVAALIHPELAVAFEALQDRLRERIITTWQVELNSRRG